MVSKSFNKTRYCGMVNDNGKAYQYRAMELIKICRLFSMASHQSPDQDVRLQSVLEACDTALERAVNSRTRKLGPTNDRFDHAIRKLYEYEKDFHNKDPSRPDADGVMNRMNHAKMKDEENGRKDWIRATDERLTIVSFHILKSPSDKNPIIVELPLISTSESKLSDILWSFSHYAPDPKKPKDHPRDEKYLTLAKNPHFYDGPPKFPTAFSDTFRTKPTENYQGNIYYVLTNNEHRVFLELGKKRRTFDNVWKTGDTLIFKDIFGNLEGEAIVKKCITANPLCLSRMEHPECQLKVVGDIEDWKAPILDLLYSSCIRIHIKIYGL